MQAITFPERFFRAVTAHPWWVILLSLVLIAAAGSGIGKLTRDTTSDAFIPKDSPALVYRDKVEEIFGLKDPMVIAVVNDGPQGVFNPHSLELVQWLSDEVAALEGIDPERVVSLATENDIEGTADGMRVEAFFEPMPTSRQLSLAVREKVMDFPLYLGSLVARDGSATLIVAEVLDQDQSKEIYEALLALTEKAPVQGERIHVAGEGAVTGYLGTYIDRDASRLNPVAAILITIMLFIAYRSLRAMLLPNLVVLGTVAVALGTMAHAGVSFFVITNAMPVILIGIAVADSIHILGQYYEEAARDPQLPARQLVIRSMMQMWRPITLTSLTTMAGFTGLLIASLMPPMKFFGLFAGIGVAFAWWLSMTLVPAVLTLLKVKPSPAFKAAEPGALRLDLYGRAMRSLGTWVSRNTLVVLVLAAVLAGVGLSGLSRLQVNENRIDNFRASEAIHQADTAINARFDGTSNLDVVIEAPQTEGLFDPERLQRIEALQRFMETLPHIKGSTSIVDYLKQMHRAMNADNRAYYRLPEDPLLVAQYFLLYSASADPTDFEEEIDYDYRTTLVRAKMDTGEFHIEREVVERLQAYLDEHFGDDLTANLSGRVNIDYHWIRRLGESHFRSVGVALLLVFLMAAVSFRSLSGGLLALAPVALAVLTIYAVMGFLGIYLAVGTSMFAAIAIGLGVDFAIHTLDRLKYLVGEAGMALEEAVPNLCANTGRALLFNFAALALGFGVLMTSAVPPLFRFGMLVAVAVSTAFIASMTLLPAMVGLFRPAFVFGKKPQPTHLQTQE